MFEFGERVLLSVCVFLTVLFFFFNCHYLLSFFLGKSSSIVNVDKCDHFTLLSLYNIFVFILNEKTQPIDIVLIIDPHGH